MVGDPLDEPAIGGWVDRRTDDPQVTVVFDLVGPVAIRLADLPVGIVGKARVDDHLRTPCAEPVGESGDPRLGSAHLGRVVVGQEKDSQNRARI